MCLWQGGTWDALLFPFDLLYILLCTPISFRANACVNALWALSLSLTFFHDFKEVSLGPSLLSVLNIDLRVTPSHCRCTQTSQLSEFTHRTQSIPNSETPCFYVLLLFPLLPPHDFTSKIHFAVNFDEWFTCFQGKNCTSNLNVFFTVTVIIFSIWCWDSTVGFLCHVVICPNLSLNAWKFWHFSKKYKVGFLCSSSCLFHRCGHWVLPSTLVFPISTTDRRFLKFFGLVCIDYAVSFLWE